MTLAVGSPVPDFTLPDDTGNPLAFSGWRQGAPALVFFYPGDFTPVCTMEACAFRNDFRDFESRGLRLLGISPDPPSRHSGFRTKYSLPFPLASDVDGVVARAWGAWGALGMARAYFLVDAGGLLRWQARAPLLGLLKLSNDTLLRAVDQYLTTEVTP